MCGFVPWNSAATRFTQKPVFPMHVRQHRTCGDLIPEGAGHESKENDFCCAGIGIGRNARSLGGLRSSRCRPNNQLEHNRRSSQFDGGTERCGRSRTLAIVHVAIHDALNAIDSRYERYVFTGNAATGASADAAVAAASHDALVGAIDVGALPFAGFGTPATQALALAQVDAAYATALAQIPDGPAKSAGIAVGQAAAAAIVALRNTDHATTLVTYTPGTEPGDWQPTPNPVPFDPPALADHLPAVLPGWGKVTPFVLQRSSQFEPKGPPRLSSSQFAADYNEVKAIGAKDSTIRSAEQTSIARFWYEGSPAGWSRIAGVVADS